MQTIRPDKRIAKGVANQILKYLYFNLSQGSFQILSFEPQQDNHSYFAEEENYNYVFLFKKSDFDIIQSMSK